MSTTTTATPDFFRMGGKKLAWYASKGPRDLRETAKAEIDRRAAKRSTKPAPAPAPAPAAGVARVGDDYRGMLDQAWARLSLEEAREILAGTVSNDAARIPA